VKKEGIIITPSRNAQSGWEEAFRKMAEQRDDRLQDKDRLENQSSWDEQEWVW